MDPRLCGTSRTGATRILALLTLGLLIAACGNRPGPIPDPTGALTLLGRYPTTRASDLAVHPDKDLVALAGYETGYVSLIDVSDPAAPVHGALLEHAPANAQDVQFHGDTLYVGLQGGDHGIAIYDITEPAAPQLVRLVGLPVNPALQHCHNLSPQPERNLLYCAANATRDLQVLDISDPHDPQPIATIGRPGGDWGCHDMVAQGNRLYAAFGDGGFVVHALDTFPSTLELVHHTYAGQWAHNLWPSPDGNTIFTTDEALQGHLRVWDISDVGNIQQIGAFNPNPKTIVHNVRIRGTLAFVSYFQQGIYVLDVSNPAEPVTLGAHDFYTKKDGGGTEFERHIAGAWGVVYDPPYVYASGMNSGLWIYELTP